MNFDTTTTNILLIVILLILAYLLGTYRRTKHKIIVKLKRKKEEKKIEHFEDPEKPEKPENIPDQQNEENRKPRIEQFGNEENRKPRIEQFVNEDIVQNNYFYDKLDTNNINSIGNQVENTQNKSQRLEIYKQWLSNNVNNYNNLADSHSENLMKMITNDKIVEADIPETFIIVNTNVNDSNEHFCGCH